MQKLVEKWKANTQSVEVQHQKTDVDIKYSQEDKELLLKDICGRLPYGVKVLVDNKHWCDFDGHTPSKITFDNSYRLLFLGVELGYVKPYLFPLSSMNEDQKKELQKLRWNFDGDDISNSESYYSEHADYVTHLECYSLIDWLNKNHFDYRGLIDKGLALDATNENIY